MAGKTALKPGDQHAVPSAPSPHSARAEPATTPPNDRRWSYEVLYAALLLGVILVALSPVLRRAGWPLNDGSTAPLLLVQMYGAHLRHFDLLPVWSSSDAWAMGSPVLLYYHRAFFYVAGLVWIVDGSNLKVAVATTLGLFMAIGAYGMRQALGMVSTSRLLCTVGSLGFLLTNYVFIDWLDPRGDFAEFSALMVVPWLLYWCLNLLRTRRVSLLLIPVMVLLVNADSAVALYSLFILATALITFVAQAGLRGLRTVGKRLILAIGATSLILAPILIAELKLTEFYDPQTKNASQATISKNFISFGSYFVQSGHRWFSGGQPNFVQIDFAIWVPVGIALVALIVHMIRLNRKSGTWNVPASARVPTTIFIVVCLTVLMLLQVRAFLFVYRVVAPLQVTNFPWRMLSFITPLGIILVVSVADTMMRRTPRRILWSAVCAVWFISLLAFSPLLSNVEYNYGFLGGGTGTFTAMPIFTAPTSIDYRTFKGFFLGTGNGELYGVFLPKVQARSGGELSNVDPLYHRLHGHDQGAQSLSSVPCTVVGPPRAPFESLVVAFSISCSGATELALPISYNDSSSVFVKERGKLRQIRYLHVATDPRIVIWVAGPRRETVVVHLPTLWGILR